MFQSILNFDIYFTRYLNKIGSPYLDSSMLYLSNSKLPIFFILILSCFYLLKYYKNKGIYLWLILIIATGISDFSSHRILKKSFKRNRPCSSTLIKLRIIQKSCVGRSGYISSHAANCFTAFTLIWLLLRRFHFLFILGLPYASLVSFSRIYLAKHYFLDIVFGSFFGISLAITMFFFINKSLLKNS